MKRYNLFINLKTLTETMRNFPKIAVSLCFISFLILGCSKETDQPETAQTLTQNALVEDDADFTYDEAFLKSANSRGMCGTIGVEVIYEGKMEFEFDVTFSGWGSIHMFNTPSGVIKTRYAFPIMVQEQGITLTNKPLAKQNPQCPWLGRPIGSIKVKVMMVQKNSIGQWEQVPGSGSVTYTLGDTTPSKVLMGGGRVFCIDKPIGRWKMCSLYK
jgi:hypothetical protein